MVPACRFDSANFPFVDPLLDCGETYAKFQSGIAQLDQDLVSFVGFIGERSSGFRLLCHFERNRTVTP